MSAIEENESANNADSKYECRSCLQASDTVCLHSLFQSWSPGWGGMKSTMAEDLAKIANIQISETDRHSKFICLSCSDQLKAACQFISLVQNNDKIQRLRYTATEDMASCEEVWPKPIQIEKTIALENWSDVDVKQEVLSEHEYDCNPDDGFGESDFNDQIDIKVETEEIVASESKININGNSPTHSINNQNIAMQNGDAYYYNDEFLDENVKEEPLSDTEDMELAPGDMPLECLLCARSFLSVSGLKAHVIAQHSYKTVKRKMGDHSPQNQQKNKYICAICKRSFSTMTDVMVHETCHNKEVCYGCNAKFDSFDKLSAHRKRCKALKSKEVVKPKTLDDVIRPKSDNAESLNVMENKEANTEDTTKILSCDLCSEKFSDTYYLTIHKEIHHNKEDNDLQSKNEPVPMEIEALENIFEEDTQCNKLSC